MSSKFMPGIIALVAVGVVQLATALPQIESNGWALVVEGDSKDSAVRADCEAVATALNSLKYGSSSISDIKCSYNRGYRLSTDEPNDVELLNTLLAFSVSDYSYGEVSAAVDLADVKSGMADMKNQLAELKALLTPECTANRLARAQGNFATNPGNSATNPGNSATNPGNSANSSDGKTNTAAIVVPIVAVLLVAAIVATVLVMKGRGTKYAEVERRAANVPPATTQPNPAFNPADAADAVPEPGSDEAQSTA
jgi:hypothetical protein